MKLVMRCMTTRRTCCQFVEQPRRFRRVLRWQAERLPYNIGHARRSKHMRVLVSLIFVLLGLRLASAADRTDKIFLQGNLAGTQTVKEESGSTVRVEYSYNDRGRGDHINATWKLDGAGVPTEYTGSGNDYMKAPVEERFEIRNGKASWKNRSENGEAPVTGEAF